MPKTQIIALLLMGVGLNLSAYAQTSSQSDTTPAPAFGQQNAPILSPENPPVSGLDEPALELRTATRSFVAPGLQVSESGDTNPNNQLGTSDAASITRLLGAFDLQQFWPKSDLFLEYLGGAAFYANPYDVRQLHAAGLEGVTRWRTGQATVRDTFSYLPDGAFNLGFGGVPGYGIAIGQGAGVGAGLPGRIQNDTLGSVGDIPRLSNTAVVDAIQAINPISALTIAGAFSNAHFYDPSKTLLNSDQITAQGGYARLVSRHDQLGLIYAFQLFQFPQASGGQVYSNIVNIRWSHTISGRMSFVAGAGPEYTELEEGGYAKNWGLSARAQLHYKLAHSSLVATYEKYTSAGSGFFAGAKTQVARLGYTRPVSRTWEFNGDMSYSHNQRLQALQAFGANATTYDEGSVLGTLRKHIGRTYDFFISYRFSEVGFDTPNPLGPSTGNLSRRQAGTIGVEWHPTPTRIE